MFFFFKNEFLGEYALVCTINPLGNYCQFLLENGLVNWEYSLILPIPNYKILTNCELEYIMQIILCDFILVIFIADFYKVNLFRLSSLILWSISILLMSFIYIDKCLFWISLDPIFVLLILYMLFITCRRNLVKNFGLGSWCQSFGLSKSCF